jgi:hypothetical protein
MTSKPVPQWVKDKEALQKHKEEPAVFIGLPGADGVIDGLLPNGEPYGWYKRRGTKDTKFKGRKV